MSLESIVIEHLVDSDFVPGEHEAYAFCTEGIPTHRIGGFLLRQLGKLDWDKIEGNLAEACAAIVAKKGDEEGEED